MSGRTALMPLVGGLAAPEHVVVWLIEASWRLRFAITPEGRLSVAPRRAITADDERFIRDHRDELVALVAYSDEQSQKPV